MRANCDVICVYSALHSGHFGLGVDYGGARVDGLAPMGQSTVAFDVRRLSQDVALHLVAEFALKKGKLSACLDSLREHRKIQSATEPEY
jgi:hypothetical protein